MRAEERVVELYGRAVAIILDRHTNGRPEAEDLYQDTFQIALGKLRHGELREPEKLPGFLAQIARNLALEYYRKAARRRTDPDSEALLEFPATGSSQLGRLLEREHAELARQMIRELANDRDREILMRFYIAEEDKDRIAADYGLSSLQFNRVLHRARQRYKTLYQERLGRAPWRGSAASILGGAIILRLLTLAMMGYRNLAG